MASIFGTSGGSNGTQITQLDPQIKQAFLGNLASANTVANNLGAQQFAPRTGDYNTGSKLLEQTALNGPGMQNMAAGAGVAQRVSNTGPMQIAAPQAKAALATSSGYDPLYGSAAQLNSNDISRYQNPYTDQVVNATMTDLERSRQMAQAGNNAAATQAGAFGGSRQAVQNALTNEAYDRNAASTLANLRNQGFNTALNAAQSDVGNRQQMALSNLGFGNQAAQFGAQAGNTAALANQAAQNNMRQFNVGTTMTAQQANQSALEAALNRQLSAGNQMANIGNMQQTAGMNNANALLNLGLQNQQYNQQQLDAIRNLPLEQQAIKNQALGINPSGGAGNTSMGTNNSRQGLFK